MKKEDKIKVVEQISEKILQYPHFYITDATGLNAKQTEDLRRLCFKEHVELMVVKNTLFKKALDKTGKKIDGIETALKSQSAIMFCETANVPAKLIKQYRGKELQKPELKGAYVEESLYIGEKSLEALANLKSKKELIANVILALQSPMQNLISQLNSAPNNIGGILKTLSEK